MIIFYFSQDAVSILVEAAYAFLISVVVRFMDRVLAAWHITALVDFLPPQGQVSSIHLELSTPQCCWTPQGRCHLRKSQPQPSSTVCQAGRPISLGFSQAVACVKIELTTPESAAWLLYVEKPISEDLGLFQRTSAGALQVREGTLKDATAPR